MLSVDALVSRAVQQATENSLTIVFGRVKAITGRTLTVQIGGVDVPGVPRMKSYNAALGEWAWCLRQGTLLVAIGCTDGAVNDILKGIPDA